MTLREIPVDQLIPGEHNPREDFDEESLNELAETIRERGVLQPLRVRVVWPDDCPGRAKCRDAHWEVDAGDCVGDCVQDGTCYLPDDPEDWRELKYEIICGQRRWAASVAAGLDVVPCVVADCDDEEALIASGIENIQREDLTPVETGQWLSSVRDGLRRLVPNSEPTIPDIADRIGKSRSWVSRYLGLVDDLPEDVAGKVTRRRGDEPGGLSEAQADPIRRLRANTEVQRKMADKTEAEDLNYKEVRAVTKAIRDNPDKADELLNTNLREEAEKSGRSVQTVVESIAKPIIVRKQERASVTEFGVITDVKSAALKMKQVLDRETFDDLIAGADDDALRMMRESLLYARESLGYALAAIDERLNISTGEIRMVK